MREVHSHEAELLKHLPVAAGRVLIPFAGGAPLIPAVMAAFNPQARVEVFELDMHAARLCSAKLAPLPSITVVTGTDPEPAEGESQTAILLVRPELDRLLVFDIIERLDRILPRGSRLVSLIPIKRSADIMKKLNLHLSRIRFMVRDRHRIICEGITKGDVDSWTPRLCWFSASIQNAAVQLCSRPGVFCHGRPDAGGLALAESIEIKPSMRILELGCGCGTTGLLVAKRMLATTQTPAGTILMVDSNTRAIACAMQNIEKNGFAFVNTLLTDQYTPGKRTFDLVIGNPPYFAENRISDYFMNVAAEALVSGGTLCLVSKHGDAMKTLAEEKGFSIETRHRRGYDVSTGTKS